MKLVKYFASILLVFLTSRSFSQTNKFDIGIDAGPSLIYMYGNSLITKYNTPSVGVSVGPSFQYNIPKVYRNRVIITIKTGLYYERKGNQASVDKVTIPLNNPDTTIITGKQIVHSNLSYLTLPILAKVSVILKKEIRVFITAGPYLSALLRYDENNHTVENTSQILKPIDSGIQAGIGVTIPIGRQFEFSVEDRNSTGLLNISRLPVWNNGTIRTFSSALLLGFNYKFGKAKTTPKSG